MSLRAVTMYYEVHVPGIPHMHVCSSGKLTMATAWSCTDTAAHVEQSQHQECYYESVKEPPQSDVPYWQGRGNRGATTKEEK